MQELSQVKVPQINCAKQKLPTANVLPGEDGPENLNPPIQR